MQGARSRRAALRHSRRDNPADALPAAQLAQVLDNQRVYLLSRLDAGLVEDLDMVPLAAPKNWCGWCGSTRRVLSWRTPRTRS